MTVGNGAEIKLSGTGNIESNKFLGDGSTTVAIDLNTNETAGILPIAKGGTGTNNSPVAGSIIYGNGTILSSTAAGLAGQVLVSDGANSPVWQNRLPDLSNTNIWIGDAGDEPVAHTISGDISMTNTGVVTVNKIQNQNVSNTDPTDGQVLVYDLNTSTWIPEDLVIPNLPTIEDGKIWIGDAGDEPVAHTISGDISMTNTGVVTVNKIQNQNVSSTDPTDGQVLVYDLNTSTWIPEDIIIPVLPAIEDG